jgi:GxxExxY protein
MIMKDNVERDTRTHAIIGAAMEVHRQLGCGFLEPVYQEALAIEFANRAILFRREVTLPVFYKEVRLNTLYRVDFICFGEIAVELKALGRFSGTEEAQLINYLKSSGHEIGLLLNFGARSLEYRRFILSKTKKSV